MNSRLIFALVFSFLTSVSFIQAQNGTLSGVIIDGETKETLIGATIRLQGADLLGAISDFDGFYSVRNVPPGTYNVSISYTGYDEKTITGVEIKPDEKQTLDVVLSTAAFVFNEVTIVEYRKTNTVAAVLLEVKQAKQVVSGVSSQQIAKSQDNNAAQVLQRVPGITIVDNRFVMIRGLSERYNNVMINNVTAPSTEVDKRTFSFDLISSSVLDRMLIYKSGSADLPGDFAGGVIKLFTIDEVEKNFTKINVGLGYRQGTTGKPYFQSEGSPTDFLGFDSGFRQLPGNFPDTRTLQSSARNAQIRQDAAHTLPNNFNPTERTASPDYSVGLSLGRNLALGSKRLTTLTTVNYSTSFQYYLRDFYRYFEWEDRTNPIDVRFQFDDQVYEKQNRISVLSNWKLRLNERNSISFKNLFNQIGENETILRRGFDFIQRPGDNLSNYLLGYRSRSIYTGQFEGTHELTPSRNLHWVAGGSFLRELEPDLRRFRTYQPGGQTERPFIMQLPPSSNLFETGRYYGKMFEVSANHGLDYTWSFAGVDGKKSNLKGGYYFDYRYRDFESRYLSYLYPGFFDPIIGQQLSELPLDRIFSKENIRTQDGFVIEEGTRPIDSYDANSLTTAGYVGTDLPLGRFDVSLGIRGEYNVQRVNSNNDFEEIKVKNEVLSPLPFINTGFNINENSVLRLAYSRTVNRPEFRELAPFLFYDYKLEAGRVGNPDLNPATIDNLDLRFEIYPRVGETFSIGAFYKYFNDPIENRTIITTEQPNFTYINADYARNYGVEVELRKSLRGVTNSPFLDNFAINANASIIRSEVDLGATATAQQRVRPLQGQSPYIVNFALYYDQQNIGLSGSLVYNIFGDRIFSVGDVLFPTIYELSRNSLDLTITKRVGARTSYKLGIQNLLDAPFRFFQDSDRNEKVTDVDHPIFTFRRGQLINLSFSYDLNK
ncbi:MAG: outer membrane beta-barrel protein [Saprospiraceae bacterium]|nr:outer membrane beta-barrel protein [Saprospiraceae bacterium]